MSVDTLMHMLMAFLRWTPRACDLYTAYLFYHKCTDGCVLNQTLEPRAPFQFVSNAVQPVSEPGLHR